MNKKYEELSKSIDVYAANKAKTISEYESALKASTKKAEECSKKMADAISADDLKAFKAAKAGYDEAQGNCIYIKGRLHEYSKGEQEEAAKAEELLGVIRDHYAHDLEKYIDSVKKPLDEVAKLSCELLEDAAAATGVISKWHTEVRPYQKALGFRGNETVYRDEMPALFQIGCIDSFIHSVDLFRDAITILESQLRKGE